MNWPQGQDIAPQVSLELPARIHQLANYLEATRNILNILDFVPQLKSDLMETQVCQVSPSFKTQKVPLSLEISRYFLILYISILLLELEGSRGGG